MATKAASSFDEAALDRLNGRLRIYGSGMSRSEAWADAVGIDPIVFYTTLTRGMPELATVTVESTHGGQSNLAIRVGDNWRRLIEVENYVSRHQQHIQFKEWRIEDKDRRGKGLGSALFRNHLDLMGAWGIRFIELGAGREDGSYYWSRRGLPLKDSHYADKFNHAARSNYTKLKDDIAPETCQIIEAILDSGAFDMNVQLARLTNSHQGKPLGAALLYATNPVCLFDAEDPQQLRNVRMALPRYSLR